MESVYLAGSEEISKAARQINQAADTMQQAANNISATLEDYKRFLDNWLYRLQMILEHKNV